MIQSLFTKGLLGLTLIFAFCPQSLSNKDTLNLASKALEQKLSVIHHLTAEFKQVVKAEGRILSNSSGTMVLERPGRLRWQALKPSKHLVVANGKKIWIYDEDLEQVTIKKQTEGGDGIVFFLSTEGALSKDFIVSERKEANQVSYDLRPKSKQSNFRHIKLIFITNCLSKIEMADHLGQHTAIQLANIKVNKKDKVHIFDFIPPKGTDIITE